jgi:glutathione S-transferase
MYSRKDRPCLTLFAHPFSSYCQKVLIALYENATPFTYRLLSPDHPENTSQFAQFWPVGKFPLLVDGDRRVMESSIIIEHLQMTHPGPVRFIPDDRSSALEVRMLDRIFDNHVMAQMQRVVNDALRPPERRDQVEVEQAEAALEKAYDWLDRWLERREWAVADAFSLADCAAAPALFYADWVHPIPEALARLTAYRARLLARPSFARAVDEARPYRPLFPLGAPDRD